MKNIINLIKLDLCILLVVISFSSCKQINSEDFNKEIVEAEVIEMFEAYHKAIEDEGFTGEFPFLDDSENFYWVPPGYTSALSLDSVTTILNASAKTYVETSFYWDTLNVYPLSSKIASYSGITKGVMVDTVGIRTEISIFESGIVIKRAEGWKLLSGQSSMLPE